MATVEFVPVRVVGKMEGTREGGPPSRKRRDDARVGVSPGRGKNFFLLRGCPCFARGRQTPLFDPLSFPIAPRSLRPLVHFRNVIHSRRDPPKSLIFSHLLSTSFPLLLFILRRAARVEQDREKNREKEGKRNF